MARTLNFDLAGVDKIFSTSAPYFLYYLIISLTPFLEKTLLDCFQVERDGGKDVGYMICVFCTCRGVKWGHLESPDIVTSKLEVLVPAFGEPLSTASWVLEGVDEARPRVWP